MGNEELYIKYLCSFLIDGSLEELYTCIELGEWDTAAKAAWTLKGTAGNLAMVRLADALEALLQGLDKSEEALEPGIIQERLEFVRQVYQDNCEIIDKVYFQRA